MYQGYASRFALLFYFSLYIIIIIYPLRNPCCISLAGFFLYRFALLFYFYFYIILFIYPLRKPLCIPVAGFFASSFALYFYSLFFIIILLYAELNTRCIPEAGFFLYRFALLFYQFFYIYIIIYPLRRYFSSFARAARSLRSGFALAPRVLCGFSALASLVGFLRFAKVGIFVRSAFV